MSATDQFVCKWCHASFGSEKRFFKHECKQMKRDNDAKSVTGQAAFIFYQTWLRCQQKSSHSIDAFKTSSYFRTFMLFVEHVKKLEMPTPDKFIWLMVEKKYSPPMWSSEEAYALYMDFLDYRVSPLTQFSNTSNVIFSFCDKRQVDTPHFFERNTPNEIIHMIRVRKLSPWFLLLSKQFMEWVTTVPSPEQFMIIESMIKPEVWKDKIGSKTDEVAKIKKLIVAMGL